MNITAFVSYDPRARGSREREAAIFIKVIKGEAEVPGSWTLDIRTAEEAISWFGETAATCLSIQHPSKPIALIPIPDSSCLYGREWQPRTFRLAEAIAHYLKNAEVHDVLRWRTSTKPSHRRGTRNPMDLFDNLVCAGGRIESLTVLVDDVVSTGSHILASAAKLASHRLICSHAFCVGRTGAAESGSNFGILALAMPDVLIHSLPTPGCRKRAPRLYTNRILTHHLKAPATMSPDPTGIDQLKPPSDCEVDKRANVSLALLRSRKLQV